MSQRKFNHLSDQSHLFSAATNIVISNFIEFFLVLPVYWISFCKKHCIWSYNTEFFWFCSNYLELNWFEISSDNKKISLFYWSIGILKIWDQVSLGEITSYSFDSVLQWKNMYFGKIWNFACRSYLYNISQSNSEILSDRFVHSNFSFFKFIID